MRKFTMTVVDKKDKLHINTKNRGYNAFELLGILEIKKDDIMRQLKCESEFERILVEDGKEYVITEKE